MRARARFDIPEELALEMIRDSANPEAVANSDVVRPVASAVDLVKNNRHVWTIDFGFMELDTAVLYERPFEHVKENVYPTRANNPSQSNPSWWQYERPRVDMREALEGLARFVSTPGVSKHRIFVWRGMEVLCNQGTLVFPRADDFFFGVLHSRLHEVWARAQGTQLRERSSGFRYTPTTCFETFPFPEPSADQRAAIAAAARELNELRERWLNPPEWVEEEVLEFPGSADGPWARYVHDPDDRGIGTVRYPRLVPRDEASAKKLKKRTLTNLYNERPTWLEQAHERLDAAVFAAYGWDTGLTDEEVLQRLLTLNLERAGEG